jgi:hypothetical protein
MDPYGVLSVMLVRILDDRQQSYRHAQCPAQVDLMGVPLVSLVAAMPFQPPHVVNWHQPPDSAKLPYK